MGRLNDSYGPRVVITLSGILLSAGILLTTRIHAGWHLYLTYGMLIGLGTAGVYVPLVSMIARWFTTRRGTMTGIAVSGIGLGTFLLSPVANYLISVYNWRTSYRILGKVLLGGLGDKTGHKMIYVIGFSMMAASVLWLTSARDTWLLYLFAVVFGLAYGGNGAAQSPLVATLFGLKSHGIILGTVNNGFTVGATVGPIASGFLFDFTGNYRTAFLVIAAVAVAGLTLTVLLRPKKAIDRVK
ncbi:MAG: MFS transporter [Deltaproteobacteria bacterium]|nr:MFS transporter [Deltaproteobacteria bacterium]